MKHDNRCLGNDSGDLKVDLLTFEGDFKELFNKIKQVAPNTTGVSFMFGTVYGTHIFWHTPSSCKSFSSIFEFVAALEYYSQKRKHNEILFRKFT